MSTEETTPEVQPEQEMDETDIEETSEEETPEETPEETSTESSLPKAPPPEEPTEEKDAKYWENQAHKYRRLYEKKKELSKGDFVTREELYKDREQQAVKNATNIQDTDTKDVAAQKAEIKDNWDAIMKYYNVADRSDAAVIEEGIYDAYAVWKRRTGSSSLSNKETIAQLSVSKSKGGTVPSTPSSKREPVLKRGKPMEEWY